MHKRKLARTVLLSAILLFLGIYSSIFALDLKVDGINPPDEKNIVPISIPIVFIPTQRVIVADMSVTIIVTYYGTLVTGKNATVYAAARLQAPSAIDNVSSVEVGFEFSFGFPLVTYDGVPVTRYVILQHSDYHYLSGANVSVFWPTAGDSAPIITFHFKDGSSFFESYPDYSIPIQPMSELQAEKANHVNVGLTVALVGFSLVEGISKLYDDWNGSGTRGKDENANSCKRHSNYYDDEYQ